MRCFSAMHSLTSSRKGLNLNNNVTHKHIETKLIFIGYGEFESKKNKSTYLYLIT
jgi:hypothetical protein